MDNYETAEENLLRVLSVEKKSPAALAGLTPTTDYLLGTTMDSFESENVLADVLEENKDSVVEIYVYNTQSDVVRVVTLIPSLKWGGRGLLGAEIGKGYLHRLPKACRDTLGVSFERKEHGNTGAVDLKLDEAVNSMQSIEEPSAGIKELINHASMEEVNNDGTEQATEQDLHQKINNLELHDKPMEENNTGNNIEKEIVDDVLNSDAQSSVCKDPASQSYLPPINNGDKPISQVTSFPATPKLEDFSLIGIMKSSSKEFETEGDLPPPPICLSVDDPQKEDLTAIDLQ
jgi:hypothetical protein